MKDMQDGFREDAERTPHEVDAADPERKDYDRGEDHQDSQAGETTDGKSHETENEATAEQEKSFAAEGEAFAAQGQASCEEGTDASDASVSNSEESSKNYSCQYAPPYYVPDFTVVEDTEPHGGDKKKKKDKQKDGASVGAGLVAAIVALCLFVSAVGGCIGYIGMNVLGDRVGGTISSIKNQSAGPTEETVTVIKNDGSIKVNEAVGSTGYTNATVAEVVADVADSVVEITTSQVATDPFYGNYVTGGAGSGVIISENGMILTNNHVIEGATEILVRLTDGSEYTASIVGQGDADFDVAVLKIEATGLSPAVMGSSADLTVGEEVVAIGNPLGELGGTVTNGIISAKDRQVIVDGHRMTLLQTNAAINPGNSGGGLFNMAGELVGIVNAKQSDTGIEGLGFAIPVDVAWSAAKDIMEYGYVTGKLQLGFSVAEESSSFIVNRYQFPSGVYISESSDSELKVYDRIVSMNGTSINGLGDYYGVIDKLKEGDTLTVVVSRVSSMGFTYSFAEHTVTLTVKVT